MLQLKIMALCNNLSGTEAAVLSSREKPMPKDAVMGVINIKMGIIRKKRHLYVTPRTALCCAHRETAVFVRTKIRLTKLR